MPLAGKAAEKPSVQLNIQRAAETRTTKPPSKIPRLSLFEKPLDVKSFSSSLPANIENIDAGDTSNVLLASDYVNDIYGYLRMLEVPCAQL